WRTAWSAHGRCAAARADGTRCPAAGSCVWLGRTVDVQHGVDARTRELGHVPSRVGAGRHDLEEVDLEVHRRRAKQPHDVPHEAFSVAEAAVEYPLAVAGKTQSHRLYRHLGIQRGLEDARVEHAGDPVVAGAA